MKSPKGKVIQPDQLMTIEEKGLPFHKNSYKFGNLFILFKVVFPEKMTMNQVNEVKSLLKGMKKKDQDMEDVQESVTMIDYEAS